MTSQETFNIYPGQYFLLPNNDRIGMTINNEIYYFDNYNHTYIFQNGIFKTSGTTQENFNLTTLIQGFAYQYGQYSSFDGKYYIFTSDSTENMDMNMTIYYEAQATPAHHLPVISILNYSNLKSFYSF